MNLVSKFHFDCEQVLRLVSLRKEPYEENAWPQAGSAFKIFRRKQPTSKELYFHLLSQNCKRTPESESVFRVYCISPLSSIVFSYVLKTSVMKFGLVLVIYFEVLHRHLRGDIVKNHENLVETGAVYHIASE
jgi:hypothetical protein